MNDKPGSLISDGVPAQKVQLTQCRKRYLLQVPFHVYTLDDRLIARTEVSNPNNCAGGGCGGAQEIFYEGKVDSEKLILVRNRVEWIELDKMPSKCGDHIHITHTIKGDRRVGERDSVGHLECVVR